MRRLAAIGVVVTGWLVSSVAIACERTPSAQAKRPSQPSCLASADKNHAPPPKQLFRGKVVLLPEALRRHGIRVNDEMQGQVVLETPDGELIPIAADWRGRAFFQDERLRDRKVELVGFRKKGVPYLQALLVYTFDENGVRLETDYWCDTCAIAFYEIKQCECCQEPIRLRFRPAELPDYLDQELHSESSIKASDSQTIK